MGVRVKILTGELEPITGFNSILKLYSGDGSGVTDNPISLKSSIMCFFIYGLSFALSFSNYYLSFKKVSSRFFNSSKRSSKYN